MSASDFTFIFIASSCSPLPTVPAIAPFDTPFCHPIFATCVWYDTDTLFNTQCAYNTWSEAVFTVLPAFTCSPLSTAVHQPANVYPLLVGVGNSPYAFPKVTVFVLAVTVPPSALNVTA